MTFNSNRVSNANTSTNADYQVANDAIGTGVDAVRYQRVKLVDGTEGSEVPTGTAANPLHVQGTSVGGDVNIAEVGGVAVALGETIKAESIPVTLAGDGSIMYRAVESSKIVDVGTTTSIVVASAGTTARAGDYLQFTAFAAAGLFQYWFKIASVASPNITLVDPLPSVPVAGVDVFRILRQTPMVTSAGGGLDINVTNITLATTDAATAAINAAVSPAFVPRWQDAIGASSVCLIAGTNSNSFNGDAATIPAVTDIAPGSSEPGLVTRNIPSGTQAVSAVSLPLPTGAATETTLAAINTKLVGGTTIGDVRLRDGAGNVLVSSTTTPGTSDRGLVGRNINYNYDSGSLAHFRAEGNSLYGTTYVTEKSATGANKSFNTGNSDTGTQRVVLAANQPTVRDSSGNAVASATTTPGASDRGLTTRSFTYTHDADGVKIGSGSAAVAYNSAGLNVRSPSDVFMGSDQPGPLVAPHGYYFYSSRTTTTGSTTTVINTTVDPSTACRRGDKIRIASGSHAEGIYQEGVVSSVSSSAITLQFPLLVAPPTSRAIYIYKPLVMTVDSSGQQLVLATPSTYFPTYPVYANKFFTESGSLGFASISGAYATVATTSTEIAIVICVNQTDVPLLFSFDSGSTDAALVMPAQTFTMPAIQNGGYIGSSMDIQVKDIGTAAASGSAYYFGYYF